MKPGCIGDGNIHSAKNIRLPDISIYFLFHGLSTEVILQPMEVSGLHVSTIDHQNLLLCFYKCEKNPNCVTQEWTTICISPASAQKEITGSTAIILPMNVLVFAAACSSAVTRSPAKRQEGWR